MIKKSIVIVLVKSDKTSSWPSSRVHTSLLFLSEALDFWNVKSIALGHFVSFVK